MKTALKLKFSDFYFFHNDHLDAFLVNNTVTSFLCSLLFSFFQQPCFTLPVLGVTI